MVREIHLANILFTDATSAKIRPILLIKANSFNDILYLPITSNLNAKGFVIDNNNLESGYLPKPSLVVYEKIGVIAPTLLIRKVSTINMLTFQKITKLLINFLKEK